ncbi:MAG TPA: hypothetical protein PKI61_01750 [bacterium]|nr:hypothetical protein [bacterium]HPT30147.1 hypothetical protein [bacterium]
MPKGFGPIGYREQDPLTKIEPNTYLSEGRDLIETENVYNLPGFEDEEERVFGEVVDDEEKGLDEEEFMAKHELANDFELVDLAKACLDYTQGKSKVKPLASDQDILDLTEYYYDRFNDQREGQEMLLSEKELNRLSPKEQEKLDKVLNEISNFSAQMADENEQRGRNFFTKSGQNSFSDPEARGNVDRLNAYFQKIKNAQKDLENLLAKARKSEEVKEDNEEAKRWEKDLAEYSEAEKKFLQSCFDFSVHKDGVKTPIFEGKDKERLTPEQILDGAQEWAEFLKMPQAKFLEKEFKGQRQLMFVEYMKDGKRINYIANDVKHQPGDYYFQINPNSFRMSKNNPKVSFAQVRILFNSRREKKVKPVLEKKISA